MSGPAFVAFPLLNQVKDNTDHRNNNLAAMIPTGREFSIADFCAGVSCALAAVMLVTVTKVARSGIFFIL